MKDKRTKILAICGPSGCGKDTIIRELIKVRRAKLSKIVQCTTRPKRDYEEDGVDYHFLAAQDAVEMLFNNEFLEMVDFNNWQYGTLEDSLDSNVINIGIFTPDAINIIEDRLDNYNLLVIYLNVKDKTRIKRALDREEEPDIEEVFRRYSTDKKDWADFKCHLELRNDNRKQEKTNIKILTELVDKWMEE